MPRLPLSVRAVRPHNKWDCIRQVASDFWTGYSSHIPYQQSYTHLTPAPSHPSIISLSSLSHSSTISPQHHLTPSTISPPAPSHFSSPQSLAKPGRVLIGEGMLTKLCRKKAKPRQVRKTTLPRLSVVVYLCCDGYVGP